MKRFEKYVIPVVALVALLMSGFSLYTTLLKPQAAVTVAVLDTQRILDRQKVKWLHGIREASGNALTVKSIETEALAFEKTFHQAVKTVIDELPETQKPQLVLEANSVLIGHSQSVMDLTPEVLKRLQLDDATYQKEREALSRDLSR